MHFVQRSVFHLLRHAPVELTRWSSVSNRTAESSDRPYS